MVYPVALDGAVVRLREMGLDDVEDVAAIIGDDKVTQWLSFDSRSGEQARAMVAGVVERAQQDPRSEYYLAVTVPPASRVAGFVRLAFGAHQGAKLGYAIAADSWGRGYATDAVRTMLAFGFGELGLHRVTAAIGPDNHASVAVVQRLGFSVEGRLRDHVYTNGAWRDSVLYSLLASEWATGRLSRRLAQAG